MTPLLKAAGSPRFGMIFAGKDERDIRSFAMEGHSVGEGILQRGPSDVYPQGFIEASSGPVETLVA